MNSISERALYLLVKYLPTRSKELGLKNWILVKLNLSKNLQCTSRIPSYIYTISVIYTGNKTGNARINVILRRLFETIVAVEKQYLVHIVSVCVWLNYAARKGHRPYYIVTSGSTIFFTLRLSHKRYGFRKKKVIEHKTCV